MSGSDGQNPNAVRGTFAPANFSAEDITGYGQTAKAQAGDVEKLKRAQSGLYLGSWDGSDQVLPGFYTSQSGAGGGENITALVEAFNYWKQQNDNRIETSKIWQKAAADMPNAFGKQTVIVAPGSKKTVIGG